MLQSDEKYIGAFLRMDSARRGYTQEELSYKLGWSRPNITLYMTQKRPVPMSFLLRYGKMIGKDTCQMLAYISEGIKPENREALDQFMADDVKPRAFKTFD